ncbi:hypothetical protein H8S37_10085 [Mediterraneibacter sp. NSJ-55]|uniref:Uncharacterized protein n=1 Tax=Mediterraneibacter hominis TaxID=2763054 RepID=A0A923RQ73_9FIRM|nr:hypothetical protein [Mediterraneibacter hominis]MBC5689264.1 hypothetical protein [Mediterraneibacter hominis]
MKYKKMSEKMSETEIEIALGIVLPEAELMSIKRDTNTNFIKATFILPGNSLYSHIEFLPNEVQIFYKDNPINGHVIGGDEGYNYLKFMIARGYSDYWKNNPYVLSE